MKSWGSKSGGNFLCREGPKKWSAHFYVQKKASKMLTARQVYILVFSSQPADFQLNVFWSLSSFSALDENWIAGSQHRCIYHRIDPLLMLGSFSYPFYGYFYFTHKQFTCQLKTPSADTLLLQNSSNFYNRTQYICTDSLSVAVTKHQHL